MKKKRDAKKAKQSSPALSREDRLELQMILDRLSVQNPEGESFRNYLESLAGILKNREEFTLAFLEHLSKKPTVAGFKVFQKLRDLVEESDNKRAVRQAAYRFEQKGFALAEGSGPQEKVVLVSREDRKATAHLVPMWGTFGFVAAIVPAEGYPVPMALTVYAHVALETIKASVIQSSHSVYRDYLRMIVREAPETKINEVPITHAARLVFELPDLLGKHDVLPDLERAKQLLKPYHDPQKPPYIHDLLEKIENPAGAVREVRIQELMDHLDFSWLLFSREDLAPYHDELQSMRNTVLVLPAEMIEDRSQALLRRAADSLCTGNKKRFFIRFFEEQALVFYLSGMMDAAKDTWITAQHLASNLLPGENPVVIQMILSSIHEHWPEADEMKMEEPEPYKTTDSGLLVLR